MEIDLINFPFNLIFGDDWVTQVVLVAGEIKSFEIIIDMSAVPVRDAEKNGVYLHRRIIPVAELRLNACSL